MKRNLHYLFVPILLVMGIMWGCSSEELNNPNTNRSERLLNHRLNKGNSLAIQFISNMDCSGNSRSCIREIESICELSINRTRASEADTIKWYVVNYANQMGYAIMTDADVANPVVAFNNKGSIRPGEETSNPGLRLYTEIISEYGINLCCSDGPTPGGNGGVIDTINLPIIHPVTPPGLEPNPGNPDLPTEYWSRAPILHPNVQEWHQDSPFNYHTPELWDEEWQSMRGCPVGCTALACAMIMSHFQWPPSYQEYVFDWDDILSYNWYQSSSSRYCTLFRLLRELGRVPNLSIAYALGGSPASKDHVKRTFANFGYFDNINAVWSKFNHNNVRTELASGYPVLISGNREGASVGHMWVVDGLYVVDLRSLAVDNDSRYHYYYHNVFGWGGVSNGCYKMPEYDLYKPDPNLNYWQQDSAEKYINLVTFSRVAPVF